MAIQINKGDVVNNEELTELFKDLKKKKEK